MTLVGYPSSDFPPPPRFSLSIPDSWQATWPVGTLLAVYGPRSKEGVQPNLLVAYQRLPKVSSFNDVVMQAVEQLRQTTPPRELEPVQPLQIENVLNAALLAASFLAEDGARVLQRQILLQLESAGTGTALLEITATYSISDTVQLQAIVDSFAFAPASVDSLLPDASAGASSGPSLSNAGMSGGRS